MPKILPNINMPLEHFFNIVQMFMGIGFDQMTLVRFDKLDKEQKEFIEKEFHKHYFKERIDYEHTVTNLCSQSNHIEVRVTVCVPDLGKLELYHLGSIGGHVVVWLDDRLMVRVDKSNAKELS